MSSEGRVPFRWPRSWSDAGLLRLVRGGPIDCLIFEDGDGGALGEAARRSGLATVEWKSLGAAPLGEQDWRGTGRVVISGLPWPRIKLSPSKNRDDVSAAPTGAPWIDSNSWTARLAQARAPERAVWLAFERDAAEGAAEETAYQTAIADSAAAGARWAMTLDGPLAAGLANGNGPALRVWRGMLAAAAFFERRRDWARYEPWGPAGILSTFAGDHEFLGQELLNLAARRGLLYRVLDRTRPPAGELGDLRAVLYADGEPPSPEWKAKLEAFATGGGLLIVPRALAGAFPQGAPAECPVAGFETRGMGKGRLAAGTRDWDDPYFLAADVHSLVSRRNDPVRLFNGRALWQHYGAAQGGGGALLQLVGFSARPKEDVTIAPARRWRTAEAHIPGMERPRTLEPLAGEGGVEYRLPPFSYYIAVEFRV